MLGSKVEERDSRLSAQKDCFDELDRNYMETKAEKDGMDTEKVSCLLHSALLLCTASSKRHLSAPSWTQGMLLCCCRGVWRSNWVSWRIVTAS